MNSSVASVAILMPALNEALYVRRAIETLLPHEDEALDYELIVLDGGSIDRTCAIVRELAKENPRIRLEYNEAGIQAAAINKGARIASPTADIIIRADCHAEYPPRFISYLSQELRKRAAASVVVPMRTFGTGYCQRAIAVTQNSRLGTGGAPHRSATTSRYVQHGHHAAFDRRAFLAGGGYDETFTHNEDAEFDYRLIKSGAKIWLSAELVITYFARKSFIALARQYANYGAGRAKTMVKHGQWPALRQALPLGILGVNIAGAGLAFVVGGVFIVPTLAYLATCAIWGCILGRSERDAACWLSGFAAVVIHHSWAAGFAYTYTKLRITGAKGLVSQVPTSAPMPITRGSEFRNSGGVQ